MSAIAAREWLEFRRDRRLLLAALLVVALALAAALASLVQVRNAEADRLAAATLDRQTWVGQGARNPHSAAHFATWAFRPQTPLSVLDPGVTPYAGSAIWMEAHARNPAAARPVADSAAGSFAGGFSTAFLLQMVVPLLLFGVGAGMVARERERGTLRLALASGAEAPAMVRAKAGALMRIAALIALPVAGAGLLAALLAGPADPVRLLLWLLAHALFLMAIAAIAVAVSALSQRSLSALTLLAALWLVMLLAVPRIEAALADRLAPAPSTEAFWGAVKADMELLPDVFGNGADAFGAEMAKRYGVGTVEELPVNFAGLQLDAAERAEADVHNRHYARLHAIYERQREVLRWLGLLSPLVPLQAVSQAIAGTRLSAQLAFERQAEAHRFDMVAALNRDMIERAGKADYDYKADAALWASLPDFAYRPPSLGEALRPALPDLALLIGWLLLGAGLIAFSGRRLARALVG